MKHTRLGFALFNLATTLVCLSALRLVLLVKFGPAGMSGGAACLALLAGSCRDFLVALLLLVPLLAWYLFVSNRWANQPWHRRLFWSACYVWWLVEIFLLGVEYFFFDEFQSRFNTVAVDYILYPHEVFINIWDSYPVGKVVLGCALAAGAWWFGARKLFGQMWEHPVSRVRRFVALAGLIALIAMLVPTINFKGATVSQDRTLNEIANNGSIALASAAWTRNLDYAAFYKTIPLDEAYQRVRSLVASTNSEFLAEGKSILRQVRGDTSRPRLNVVLLLEESFGSEFWGCLGRTNTLTPEMDKLALDEGILFTNLYASGNRTVRGLEGVLSSFPPLPGDSIVKRDRSDNVETLARVLRRDGYASVFLYGGRGLFDGMRSFAVNNGFERFVEQKDFANPTYTTIWGVCDEDIFARSIEEFRELSRQGKPFFGTVLSVSNHKPYTYPAGKIPEDPNEQRRENAVKYSDFALGEFFRAARKESFWTNTIFVVVADHGARVYGSQSIPIYSYEIPLVVLGPAVVKEASRIGTLGGSLDVAPTILGLLGRPYESMFFGRDLLSESPVTGRAALNHNRDVGLFMHDRLVVLGMKQSVEFYAGNPKVVDMKLMTAPTAEELELEQDAIALYQVADDLYIHQRYRIDASDRPVSK
jgi:phosphoglycerol transferase MdoB-like AlkP superfamily enzyme